MYCEEKQAVGKRLKWDRLVNNTFLANILQKEAIFHDILTACEEESQTIIIIILYLYSA